MEFIEHFQQLKVLHNSKRFTIKEKYGMHK